MNKPFDFRTTTYFSGGIMFMGVCMLLPGIFISSINILATLPFFLIFLIIVTTHYRLEVSVENKTYRQYVWLLGLKWGERERFEEIEYIFIKKNKVSQTIHSRITTRDVHSKVYDGFLRFSEKDKVHLGTATNKENLLKKMAAIAKPLQLPIVDYSEGEAKVIPTS